MLTVVASDGRELEPIDVESFIIQAGERMDFQLTTSNTAGKYMIIAETLEVLASNQAPHRAEAVLNYNNAPPGSRPSISPLSCSDFPDNVCPVFNCPFLYYPTGSNRKCVTFHDALANPDEVPSDYHDIVYGQANKLFFLNFAFPGKDGNTPGSVNGRQFRSPSVSAISQPQELGSVSCDNEDCGSQKICSCMHSINIENNDIVEIVLLNMGVGSGWSHPVHLHGHSFYVRAIGYPEYDRNTGRIINPNRAIDCRGSYCNNATWHGERKVADKAEGYIPLKDTIIVPTGGYVIVRFKADNPGVWFLHCHIDLHNTNGMAMVINESFNLHPKTEMPRCRNYFNDTEYRAMERKYEDKTRPDIHDPGYELARGFAIALGIVLFIVAVILGVIVVKYIRLKKMGAYQPIQGGDN